MIPTLFTLRVGEFRLPDFARLSDDDWAGHFEQTMADQRAVLEEIATNDTPDITLIHDWERSGV